MFRKKLVKNKTDQTGQGMVEFALVLPVVMFIVLGIIEVGFLLFTYSSVNSAAREAARYGIAIGEVGSAQRYYDCDGIRSAGLRIGSFAGMTEDEFTIVYDEGPDSTSPKYASCEALADAGSSNLIRFGDRIVVTVNHQYNPLVSYMGLNFGPFNMSSTSSRTIIKGAQVVAGGGDSGGGGGGGGGGGEGETCDNPQTVVFNVLGGEGLPPLRSASTQDCAAGTWDVGEVVTLTGQPAPGYYVSGWADADNNGPNNVTTVTVPDGGVVGAVYYLNVPPDCYVLGVSVGGGGIGGSAPNKNPQFSTECLAGKYMAGATVNLTALPTSGYQVASWSGTDDDTSKALTNTVTMPSADHSVVVAYEPVPAATCFTLSLDKDGNGDRPVPTPTNSAGCGTEQYTVGTIVSLTANPDPNNEVDSWLGTNNDSSTANVNTVTMNSDKSVIVYYAVADVKDAPKNPAIASFNWNNGLQQCSSIQFKWDPQPSSVWPQAPIGYRISQGTDLSNLAPIGIVTGTSFLSSSIVPNLGTISFGVQAIFVNGLEYSKTLQVRYLCSNGAMIPQGSPVVKETP